MLGDAGGERNRLDPMTLDRDPDDEATERNRLDLMTLDRDLDDEATDAAQDLQ